MDRGVSYTYRHAAYPRYRYYQQHLKKVMDRWQKILDAGGLPDCISRGKSKLKDIISAANQVDDKVKVNVFADSSFLETRMSELTLQCNTKVGGKADMINWTGFIKEERKGYEPVITVIVLPSHEEKGLAGVKDQLSHLPKVMVKSVIIFFADTKTCFPYPDVRAEDVARVESKTSHITSQSLDTEIQYLLEDKAISVLEQIAAYNQPFVPKKQEDQVETLESKINLELVKSMRNQFVVKDLSPDGNDKFEGNERKPTDKELTKISMAIGSNWEMLGPSLGVFPVQIEDIKKKYETAQLQIYNMLLIWRERDGASLRYLLQLIENVSAITTVDFDVIKELKTPFHKADTERDEIFHKKLKDFVAKKTKCAACDYMTKKYGISSSLINEFLNEGFYCYEKKVEELIATMRVPSWPRDKSDNGVSTCTLFSYQYCHDMSKMVLETENYIKRKHNVLMLVKKIQFQLFGLLGDTDVETETNIPEAPKLSVDLQRRLLEFSEVYGCGILWGELVIHVTKELIPKQREEIKGLLENYMYTHGFRTEIVVSEREEAGGSIEHGAGIRATKVTADENGNYMYGSLGCFVHIQERAKEATNVAETEKRLYGLTCAHFVEGCGSKVDVRHGENFVELGERRHSIYEPHTFDVASVEIDKTKARNCEKSLKNGNQECCGVWNILGIGKSPVGKPVYKYGCATGFTTGTCVSNNYQTKKMMDDWNKRLQEKNEPGNFNPVNIILISREDIKEGIEGIDVTQEASPTGQEPMQCDNQEDVFSKSGDSGSVVCKDVPGNENVEAVSILLGSIKTKKETYSYSNDLYATREELQRRFSCIIQPAQ